MMTCLNSKDGEVYKIFDITYDSNGFPLFLIYKNGQWMRQSAKHFTPTKKFVKNKNSEVLIEMTRHWTRA